MSVWNEILVKVGKKYNIISWGREIDAGRSFGILRLSTVFMKAHHILALCQAIEQGAHLLQEISIHFSAFEDKHDQLVNPFLPRGIHYQYLSYLDHPIPQVCNPYPQKKTGTIYDRLNGEGQGKASTDLKPKDKEKTEATEQMNSSKGFQLALQKLMKTICGKVQEMCNLKLLAFYNLNIQNFSIKLQNELQDGLYHISSTQFLFEGLIFRNCELERRANQLIGALAEVFSLKLLVLSNVGLSDIKQDLKLLLEKHQSERDQKLWEQSLKDRRISFSRAKSDVRSLSASKSTKKQPFVDLNKINDQPVEQLQPKQKYKFTPEELKSMRIRHELKGIQYIDLGYNDLDNKFLESIIETLINDHYVNSLDLIGNKFDLRVKTIRKGQNVVQIDYGTEELLDWDLWEQDRPPVRTTPVLVSRYAQQPKAVSPKINKLKPQILNNKVYLPVALAAQCDVLDKIDHYQTLDNFQRFILHTSVPNFMRYSQIQSVQLLQNYSSSSSELEELKQLQAHPLVRLMLQNTTLTHVSLGEETNFALKKFVELRLELNKRCVTELLTKFAERELTKIEKEEIDQSLGLNLKNPTSLFQKIQHQRSISHQRQSRSASIQRQREEQNVKLPLQEISLPKNNKAYDLVKQFAKAKSAPKKLRDLQIKTTESIKQDRARTAKTKSQQQKKVTKVLSTSRSYSKQKNDVSSPSGKKDSQMQILQQQIQQQKEELERLQKKLAKKKNSSFDEDSEPSQGKAGQIKYKNHQDDYQEPVQDTLFDDILEAAYQMLMRRAKDDKTKALALFNQHQDEILVECEKLMRKVQMGAVPESEIANELVKVVVI
ncbi:Conserved_hypothetical protein [Hexamita inflata]|uniref:Uncharacterized protein n=1 Tax=Hexamita inflata TaxID=28002 RepID=A0AA86PXA8_9EUKA|nr:Conserved hypothetical protein [Hexamita inflata]